MPVLGIDVSKWNEVMNWPVAYAAGARFAFIRAGSINNVTGVCYTDYQFEANRAAASVMPVGYYWYFRPNWDPIRQADYFCNLIRSAVWQLPPVVDVEELGNLPAGSVADVLEQFCFRVRRNLGGYPIIYTRAMLWNVGVAPRPLWRQMKLWIALYDEVIDDPWVGLAPKYKPRDWGRWTFWQYSADHNQRGREFGSSANGDPDMDLNYYNGTLEEFYQEFCITCTDPVLPDPPATIFSMNVVQAGLRIRTGPGTNYTEIGRLEAGQQVEAVDLGGDDCWVQIKLADGSTGWANVQLGDDRNMELG